MLQVVTANSDRFSIAEQAQMAVEGGARWIELRSWALTAEARAHEIEEAAADVVAICKEADAHLIIASDPDLALRLECGGVHLDGVTDPSPREVREKLGPAAIIGVTVTDAREIIGLRTADIDYVRIIAANADDLQQKVATVEDAGVEIPVVGAYVTVADAETFLRAGCKGVAASHEVFEATDPVAYVSAILSEINPA